MVGDYCQNISIDTTFSKITGRPIEEAVRFDTIGYNLGGLWEVTEIIAISMRHCSGVLWSKCPFDNNIRYSNGWGICT